MSGEGNNGGARLPEVHSTEDESAAGSNETHQKDVEGKTITSADYKKWTEENLTAKQMADRIKEWSVKNEVPIGRVRIDDKHWEGMKKGDRKAFIRFKNMATPEKCMSIAMQRKVKNLVKHMLYDDERLIHRKIANDEPVENFEIDRLQKYVEALSCFKKNPKNNLEGLLRKRFNFIKHAHGQENPKDTEEFALAVGLAAFDAFRDKLDKCPIMALDALRKGGDNAIENACKKLDELDEVTKRCKDILDNIPKEDTRFDIVRKIKEFCEKHVETIRVTDRKAPVNDVEQELEKLKSCRKGANTQDEASLEPIKEDYKTIHDAHENVRNKALKLHRQLFPTKKRGGKGKESKGKKSKGKKGDSEIRDPKGDAKADTGNGEVEDLIKQIEMELKNKK